MNFGHSADVLSKIAGPEISFDFVLSPTALAREITSEAMPSGSLAVDLNAYDTAFFDAIRCQTYGCRVTDDGSASSDAAVQPAQCKCMTS